MTSLKYFGTQKVLRRIAPLARMSPKSIRSIPDWAKRGYALMLKISLLKVDGHSMHPAITSGVFVLVWRWQIAKHRQRLRVDDIVAVEHPEYGKIIKRISAIRTASQDQSQGQKQSQKQDQKQDQKYGELIELSLRGDNELASISEARMGWVSVESVIGKVVYVVKARR